MTNNVTPWFDGDIKPSRPGIYQREFPRTLYAKWTGAQWLCGHRTARTASKEQNVSYQQTRVRWRGLAKEPR